MQPVESILMSYFYSYLYVCVPVSAGAHGVQNRALDNHI